MTRFALLLASLILLQPASALAQQDNSAAAQRAQIANQRIQAEAQRQAEEEAKRAEAEARQAAALLAARARQAQAQQLANPAAETPALPTGQPQTPPASEEPPAAPMGETLEQIRTLGELRDAGYVTEEEFQRIKSRILDDRL